jgi:catechol 2,3-dioxygenase-like lactoylglutathione lyase family enzyme
MTSINHVGVTVPDLEKAVDWYQKVFGLELLDGPMHCDLTTAGASRRLDVFGPQWKAMRLAHLITSNGAGFELFQFVDPPVESPEDNFTYTTIGPHHVAFTVEDFHGTLNKLNDTGGRQRTAVYDVHGGELIVYCEDPWGNIVELVSTSYRDLSSATAVP